MDRIDKHIPLTAKINNLNFGNEMVKKTQCNGTGGDSDTVYYGVHIPTDIQVIDSDGYSNVFQDKLEALKVVKKYKKARFKAFNFYHEAVEFAVHGAEFPNNNMTPNISGVCGSSTPEAPLINKESAQPSVGEKPPPFRGPKSQDLVKLRKGIEAGQLDVVQITIWENPRYLISSGDTPSILQEGSRYNALHVAAKAKNRDMTELILNTISNTSFIKLLYGDDSHQDADERAKMLVDLYLNTPDKGLNETPLHFAVKFGAVDVVELLVSFPQCDKTVKNKFGKSPSMIICDRCEGTTSSVIKNKIAMLLEETFYVPVLRSEDSCTPPVIGEPFAPSSPPNFNTDILLPRMEIHAYAGPMNKEGANKFRRIWKTPPRSLKLEASTVETSHNNSIDPVAAALKFKDLDKGLERLGRALASKFEVAWKEYWPFLGSFIDLSTTEGLRQLEHYLGERVNSEFSCSSSKCTSSSESDLINNSPKLRSKDLSEQDSVLSPISDLCKNLEACTLSDNGKGRYSNHIKTNLNTSCSALTETIQDVVLEAQLFKADLNPFMYIEKSCHVFAHRISNDILHLLESDYGNTLPVKLENEMKQLEHLMASFMDDSRFISMDFHLVHYRLGSLISSKLKDVLVLEDEYDYVKKSLEHWLETCSKHFDYFSSDDESGSYRQTAFQQKKTTSKNKQVMCLLECILNTFALDTQTLSTPISNEEECVQVWRDAKPCACVWQPQSTRKSSLIKKANSFKYTSRALASSFRSELENVSRQLSFGDDELGSNNVKDHCDIVIAKLSNSQSIESSSSDEDYFTPPSTPNSMEDDSDEEDVFEDSFSPEHDVFIEGNVPTKTDYAVYNAVMCAADRLNSRDYPNIYKWRHAVSLFPESEQRSWASPSIGRCTIGPPAAASTPPRRLETPTPNVYTPPSSWFRITGANSPRDSLKRYRRSNISFNL